MNSAMSSRSNKFGNNLGGAKNNNVGQLSAEREAINDQELQKLPTQSSVSQAFTQDMSDWNKESAIVEDQVQKFLLRKDAKS